MASRRAKNSQDTQNSESNRHSFWHFHVNSNERLTQYSNPGDHSLYAFYIQKDILYATLAIIGIASVLLFGYAIWLRHQPLSMLYYYLVDGIGDITAKRRKTFKDAILKGDDVFMPDLLTYEDIHNPGVDLHPLTRIPTDLLLTTVLFLWTTFIAGVLSINEKNKIFAIAFIFSCQVCIVMEIIATYLFVTAYEPVSENLEAKMLEMFQTEYDEGRQASTINRIFNSLMVVGKCCGVRGPEDFENMVASSAYYGNASTNAGLSTFSDGYDYAGFSRYCCAVDAWNTRDLERENGELLCVLKGYGDDDGGKNTNTMHYTNGCFETWKNHFVQGNSMMLIVITVVLCTIHLIQTCIGGFIFSWARGANHHGQVLDDRIFMSDNSQQWGTGLRTTTMSEMQLANDISRRMDIAARRNYEPPTFPFHWFRRAGSSVKTALTPDRRKSAYIS